MNNEEKNIKKSLISFFETFGTFVFLKNQIGNSKIKIFENKLK